MRGLNSKPERTRQERANAYREKVSGEDEESESRTMFGKRVTKFWKGDKMIRWEVDGKTFKTIEELQKYIPELK